MFFSKVQCAYSWIESEEVQDMSRILKVILYQTAESLGSPRWELRRIANQVWTMNKFLNDIF